MYIGSVHFKPMLFKGHCISLPLTLGANSSLQTEHTDILHVFNQRLYFILVKIKKENTIFS